MRAVLARELGGPEKLELVDLPAPECGIGEVRIRVEAAGINFADSLMLEGRYQERPPLPFIPGLEVAGRIDALGPGVDGFEKGQRVLALLDHGGFAEQVVARATDVTVLPDTIDAASAAALAIAYGTAFGGLVWRGALRAGETLLVNGAAGGVGLAAVECGKALGATVIATARGGDRLAVARAHGADHVLDSETDDLVGRLKDLAGNRRIDVTFDPIGGSLFDAALRCAAWEGRIITIGFASGTVPQVPANILLVKNVTVAGFYWGSYRKHDPERIAAGFGQLFSWHEQGLIHPHIGERVTLAEVPGSIERLRRRQVTGKLVVAVQH